MSSELNQVGLKLHSLANKLWPIARSITGQGVRDTLKILNNELSGAIKIYSVPSGTNAFDWTVPDEWNINSAWIENEKGEKVVNFNENNLHVVGYSVPVDEWLSLEELQNHLFSLPEQPDAIPYITSYYKKMWGFCISENKRKLLQEGSYRAVIDSDLKSGFLNYGEIIIKGESDDEILLSTYICHPSMANNEISGPVVMTAIVNWLKSLKNTRYTYRVIFIPETIGSLVYLSKNLEHLKTNVKAGFNVTCIGDERCYSYLPSRAGTTLADRAAIHSLKHIDPNYIKYTWLDRGSDERQYCSPGIDLPIATIMRSKFGEYPEYHTSLDDLNLVTAKGLSGGFEALRDAIQAIEFNCIPKSTVYGEPQLGKRGLYPTLSQKGSANTVKIIMDLLSYSDGVKDLLEIAEIINTPIKSLKEVVEQLESNGLIYNVA